MHSTHTFKVMSLRTLNDMGEMQDINSMYSMSLILLKNVYMYVCKRLVICGWWDNRYLLLYTSLSGQKNVHHLYNRENISIFLNLRSYNYLRNPLDFSRFF